VTARFSLARIEAQHVLNAVLKAIFGASACYRVGVWYEGLVRLALDKAPCFNLLVLGCHCSASTQDSQNGQNLDSKGEHSE